MRRPPQRIQNVVPTPVRTSQRSLELRIDLGALKRLTGLRVRRLEHQLSSALLTAESAWLTCRAWRAPRLLSSRLYEPARQRHSAVAKCLDELGLPLAGVPGQPNLFSLLLQFGNRPVVVVAGLSALASNSRSPPCGRGIGDAGCLLLACAVFPQLLIQFRVLQRRALSLRHDQSPFPPVTGSTAPET